MRSAAEVLDAINDLERRFPVQSWRAGDIDLWPTYRTRLFMNVTLALLAQAPPRALHARLVTLVARGSRAIWKVPLASLRDRPMNASPQPGAKAVFLSDGLSFTRLDGYWYDRIVDPLLLGLRARGDRVLKLTPLPDVHVPRAVPSMLIQPTVDRIKLLAGLHRVEATLPHFEAFLGAARGEFGAHAPGIDWLRLQAKRLDALAGWFSRLLARTGATHALVNNYYSLEGSAFVLAARRESMISIDLQHGLQGEQHCAYGRWLNVPKAGYTTLPDEFWVWGSAESSAIDAWRAGCLRHVPRVTGNLWRDRWLDDSDPSTIRYLELARGLRTKGTAQVLVNLSWGLADEETEKIIRAAQITDPSIAWWWRLHPVDAHRHGEFAARLRRLGLTDRHVAAVTELPLFALLRAADLTISHSSTALQEAALFGVPSVISSDYGAELHADLLQRGIATKATTDSAIAAAVGALVGRPRPPAPAVAPSRRALDEAIALLSSAESQSYSLRK